MHVLHVSHPAALEGTTRFAREIVDKFFSAHTSIDVSHIEAHNHKFRNLTADSRLEIAFAGRPRKYKVPSYQLYITKLQKDFLLFLKWNLDLLSCIFRHIVTMIC